MKLLIVGDWQYDHYEYSFRRSLEKLGVRCGAFNVLEKLSNITKILSQRIPLGTSTLKELNESIYATVCTEAYTHVLFWRPIFVFPELLIRLNHTGVHTISYNNDDPFSPHLQSLTKLRHFLRWRIYNNCLPYFKTNFFYRSINVNEAKQKGILNSYLLMPGFDTDTDAISTKHKYSELNNSIIFIGHYEADGRAEYLKTLHEIGYSVRVWGGRGWNKNNLGKKFYNDIQPIHEVYGQEYRKLIASSAISLCFLSKLNRDTYTRRCFEIPAIGGLLMAPWTHDLSLLFRHNVDAVLYKDKNDFIDHIVYLMQNPEKRDNIKMNGKKRIQDIKASNVDRAKQFLSIVI